MTSVRILLKQAISGMGMLFDTLILIRCLISWLPVDRSNKLVDLLYTLTEPVLAPIRRLFDRSPLGGYGMRIDFSPIIAILLVDIVCSILMSIIDYV